MRFAEEPMDTEQIKERLSECADEELSEIKLWLFKENVRLKMEQSELKHAMDKLQEERKQLENEAAEFDRRFAVERKRLKQEEAFFDKKMDILKNGFLQLDLERKKLDREKLQLEAERAVHASNRRQEKNMDLGEMLFQGVNSQLALKKRYKDLIKMFHPDNIAGDHEMVLIINRIYEELKKDYEIGKNA